MAKLPPEITACVTLDMKCPDCESEQAELRMILPVEASLVEGTNKVAFAVPAESVEVHIKCLGCPAEIKSLATPFRLVEGRP